MGLGTVIRKSKYNMGYVEANLDKPWKWHYLSGNPNITWDIVKANLDKKWNWFNLSQNPNITWDIIQQNRDKPWDWNLLSDNCMSKSKNNWINKRRLKHIKAYQIQTHWRHYSCNPEYKLAQRCLLRLYGS